MGRWTTQDEMVCIKGTVVCYAAQDEDEAAGIMRKHNADCDAYEAKIAELEAELARVKAESLRVVKVGEPVMSYEMGRRLLAKTFDTITSKGQVLIHEPNYKNWFNLNGIGMDTMMAFKVQPVRLEKWDATPTNQQKEAG